MIVKQPCFMCITVIGDMGFNYNYKLCTKEEITFLFFSIKS